MIAVMLHIGNAISADDGALPQWLPFRQVSFMSNPGSLWLSWRAEFACAAIGKY